MLKCRCGEAFLSGDAYIAHLVASHEGTGRLVDWLARGLQLLSWPANEGASAPPLIYATDEASPVRLR